ncbi:MAG: hypothetical protein JWP57_1571 [Spirosoma sp.]|nr:hypothetical protein [Spirosoma sp.]
MATTLNNINLFVRDVAGVKAFYTNVLGLLEDTHRSAPPVFCYLQAGSCSLTLQDSSTPGAQTGPADSIEIGFAVDDVETIRQRLAESKANIGEVQQMGWGDTLEACDPEGHRLNLFTMKSFG